MAQFCYRTCRYINKHAPPGGFETNLPVQYHTAETREKIAESMRGKTRPQHVREKIAATLTGKPKSPQHIARMAASQKARRERERNAA